MEDGLERIPDESVRRVMRQGIRLGQALLLRDQAARRFGKQTAPWLFYLVDDLSGRESIDRVTDALIECGAASRKKIKGRMIWSYPPRQVQREAETMAQVVDQFQLSLDELFEQGVEHGFRKGQVQVLHRLADHKFGEETARQLSELLDGQPRPVDIDKVTDTLIECAVGDEFIDRVRMV